MMTPMKYYIYTLSCPISLQVRYVGKTNDIIKRLYNHLCDRTRSYKASWIKSLLNKKLRPIIEIIDETEDINEVYNLEVYWISQFRSWGFELVNLTDGGEGFSNKDVFGENNWNTKITEPIAKLIIEDIKLDIFTIAELCTKYKVGRGTISNIKYGKSWLQLTQGKRLVTTRYKQKESGKRNRVISRYKNGKY